MAGSDQVQRRTAAAGGIAGIDNHVSEVPTGSPEGGGKPVVDGAAAGACGAATKVDIDEVKAQLAELFTLMLGNGAATSQPPSAAAALKAPRRIAGDGAGDPLDGPDILEDSISLAG